MAQSSPFAGAYSPASIRWWMATIDGARWDRSAYGHFETLLEMLHGRSADETEQLSYCHERVVVDGARSTSGLWCVCLKEDAPATVARRAGGGGDGVAALLCVKQDLESAADALPISWKSTERIFQAQLRSGVWAARFTYYNRNLRVRPIDRWLEPRDPETGRPQSTQLAHYLMAVSLGAKTECRWPKPQSLVEREVFTANVRVAA